MQGINVTGKRQCLPCVKSSWRVGCEGRGITGVPRCAQVHSSPCQQPSQGLGFPLPAHPAALIMQPSGHFACIMLTCFTRGQQSPGLRRLHLSSPPAPQLVVAPSHFSHVCRWGCCLVSGPLGAPLKATALEKSTMYSTPQLKAVGHASPRPLRVCSSFSGNDLLDGAEPISLPGGWK